MAGKCILADCAAPVSCHDGKEDHKNCPNWTENASQKENEKHDDNSPKSNLDWTGQYLFNEELGTISSRATPIIIGLVGKAAAGKTSFLAMVYTLLLNGKQFKKYNFSGTKTILAWDELYHKLKFNKGDIPFPDPTPAGSNRLYHLAFRKEEALSDVLFSDASGESFSFWAENRHDDNAESSRWIYDNSNAFILFIDCESLAERKNAAKMEIINIAQQLTHDLRNRPVIGVWSKSDKKKEIHKTIRESLKSELENLFPNYTEMDISNFLPPDTDESIQKNIKVIDWLLEKVDAPSNVDLTLSKKNAPDTFLNYFGHE